MFTLKIQKTEDPWVDFWYVRVINTHGRPLAMGRVPCAPPYTVKFKTDVRVIIDRVEFLDHDLRVLAEFTEFRGKELLGGGRFAFDISDYETNGKKFCR